MTVGNDLFALRDFFQWLGTDPDTAVCYFRDDHEKREGED
jgi:hypothetical protein